MTNLINKSELAWEAYYGGWKWQNVERPNQKFAIGVRGIGG
jgi:hypothetical protein